MSDSMFCEIKVKGHLAQRWSDWLGGLTVENQLDGHTRLSGSLADQAALYGVLHQMRDLGLALVSIHCIKSRCCVESRGCGSTQHGDGPKGARGDNDRPQPDTR